MTYSIKAADKGRRPQEADWRYFSPQTYLTDQKYTVIEEGSDQIAYLSGEEPKGNNVDKYNEWELGKNAISRTWARGVNEITSVTKVVFLGKFTYSPKGVFNGGVINSYAFAIKEGSAGLEYTFIFENPLEVLATNFYGIGQEELVAA